MGWIARSWLDRIRGRRGTPEQEAAAQRSEDRRQEGEAERPVEPGDVEEGATAARDETLGRHEPFHPPGG